MYKMKKIHEESWVSHFIVPNSDKALSPATKTKACEFELSNGKSSQQIFSREVVPKNSDPRSFMLVTRSLLFQDMDPVFFDPELDPPNKACFNCWEVGYRGNFKIRHLHYRCPKPKLREFCENCGRQGIDVQRCPRCARGYHEYGRRDYKGKYMGNCRKSTDVSECEAKEMKSFAGEGLQLGFRILDSKGYEKVAFDVEADSFGFKYQDSEKEIGKQDENDLKLGAYDENFVSSDTTNGCSTTNKDENSDKEVVDEDEDENYEEIFIDEDERSELGNSSDIVQDFLNIMEASKFLPIKTQSCIALKFAKKRREMIDQKKK